MAKELNLGEMCDAIQRKNDEIGEAEATVRALKQEEATMRERMEEAMKKQGTTSVRGELATIGMHTLQNRRVKDWDRFYKWLQREPGGGYHFLQRRLSEVAVREKVEERRGKELPGTETFEQVRLSVTRIK